MSAEEAYVNVVSEDDEEIDVGTDPKAEEIADSFDEDGGDGASKGKHHNQLEKQRRKTLNATYNRLTKIVKYFSPKHRNIRMGRDKTLALGLKLLKKTFETEKAQHADTRRLIREFTEELENTVCPERREVLKKGIGELEDLNNGKLISPEEVEQCKREIEQEAEALNTDNNDISDESDGSGDEIDDSDDDEANFEDNENVTPHHSP